MATTISDEARLLLWEDYQRDLAGWSPEMIAEACDRYRRSEERWYPTSGQLLALLRQIAAERAPRVKPVRRLAPPPMTEAEREAVRGQFGALLAKMRVTPGNNIGAKAVNLAVEGYSAGDPLVGYRGRVEAALESIRASLPPIPSAADPMDKPNG